MKKILLLPAFLIFSGLGIYAQDNKDHTGHGHNDAKSITDPVKTAAAAQANNPNAPDIQFEKVVHDFGTVKQGADGTCEFKFKNTGKEPLIISECRASCGCTTPTCPKDQLIKPGETSVIKVKYDMNRVGPINKSITISSNAKSGEKVLQIKGNVEAAPVQEAFPTKKTGTGMPLENNN
jgi:hypothetical protein